MRFQSLTMLFSAALCAVAARSAHAEPISNENEGKPPSDEQRFAFRADDLKELKPETGVDRATITGKPAWCDAAGPFAIADKWDSGRIARTVDARYGIEGTIEGALHICQRPTDATWKTYAGLILQKWMNWTHLSQADAEKSLRGRIQMAKFTAQRDELCKALEPSPEAGGEVQTYAEAKLQFFGCTNDHQTLWQDPGQLNIGGVGYYLDGDTQTDELMRAYWLFGFVRDPFGKTLPGNNASDNLPLLYYAVAQNDFAHLDIPAIEKQLAAAPYNDYARTVAAETFGVLEARQKVYEKAIEKLTKGDEDYTAILRNAPKKAWAQWEKLATDWKAEIDRSNAFEKLLSLPSRKALKGCSVELTKDVAKLIKSFKITVYKDLVEKIGADPVANLLLGRLALCDAFEEVPGISGALNDLVTHGRSLRGPRSLAFYAIVDAVAEARKDRPRLLLELANFFPSGGVLSGTINFDTRHVDFDGHAPSEWEQSRERGVVGSTKKVEDGLQITFKKVILTLPDYSCHDDVNHPMRINPDGRIEYYQNCKSLGTFSKVDVTPKPFVTWATFAAGVKPGVFIRYMTGNRTAKNGNSFGAFVFVKKTPDDKKINTFFGFEL